jgi:O-antigen/teichoic acid export membrane protein
MAPNNTDSLRNKTITGAFWQLLQKSSVQLVSFVVSVILARLIDPAEFGIVAMASIFMAVAGAIADGGLGTSLVQRKDIDKLDQDTVFHFGMLVSVILYTILYFCAPLISRIYKTEELTAIVRVASLSLFATSFNSVQGALVMREMDFKKYFWANLIATLISAGVGITMAYLGFGVWALVAQTLTRSITAVLVLFTFVRWLPRFRFSWKRLKQLYAFGLNLMGANLIGTFFNELRGFLIGLRFQPADLAYFNRGNSIPGLINDNVNGTISTVLFPAIAKLQDDKLAVKSSMRHAMMTSVFIMAPLMLLLASSSRGIILLLYTDKWVQAVPFMQVIVFYHLFSIVGLANLQALNAIGRSDITFKLEFIKKPTLLAILLYTCTISPLALSIGTAIYAIIGAAINAYPNRKLIGYSYREQLADVLPQIGLALISGASAWAIGYIDAPLLLILILQWIVGGTVYLLLAKILHLVSFNYALQTIKGYLHR